MLDSLIKEDHLVSIPSVSKASAGGAAEAAVSSAVVAASVHPVTLSVEERLSCQVRAARCCSLPVVYCVCVCFFFMFCLLVVSSISRRESPSL